MKTIRKRPEMAEPDRPPIGRRASSASRTPLPLLLPPIDRPVGRPKGSGKKPGPAVPGPAAAAAPQQLVWVRIVCQPGAPVGRDIALDIGQSALSPSPHL